MLQGEKKKKLFSQNRLHFSFLFLCLHVSVSYWLQDTVGAMHQDANLLGYLPINILQDPQNFVGREALKKYLSFRVPNTTGHVPAFNVFFWRILSYYVYFEVVSDLFVKAFLAEAVWNLVSLTLEIHLQIGECLYLLNGTFKWNFPSKKNKWSFICYWYWSVSSVWSE